MQTRITVKDANEAAAIREAMNDPATRALVTIVGILLPRSRRSQKRILSFVADKVDEDKHARYFAAAKEDWH